MTLTATESDKAIGATTAANDINVTLTGTLTATASTGAGGIFVTETGDMSVVTVDAGTGNVELESDGTITDTGADNTVVDVTGAALTIRNSTGVGQSAGDSLNLSVDTLNITTTSGNAFITEANGIALGAVNVMANGLTFEAILGDITDTTGDVTAGALSLTATESGKAIGTTGTPITVDASGTLTANATTSTGGIFIAEQSGSLALGTVNAGTGDIELSAPSGFTNATSALTGANLKLTASASGGSIGATTAANDINVTLTGTLTATASTGAGGIFITETGDMSVVSVNAGDG